MPLTPAGRIDLGPYQPASVWPDRSQLCLLKAALWSGEEARTAWVEWQKITNPGAIDFSSWNLLPLAWRNLTNQGVKDDPLLAESQGYYRFHWAKNQVLLNRTAAWVAAWQARGIPVVVLKGVPLLLECYRDAGLRPMSDVDLLVPVSQVREVAALLQAEGWIKHMHKLEWEHVTLEAQQSYNWQKGDARLDLHWHVDERCTEPGVTDWQWAQAQPLTFKGVTTRQLCPEHLLVHVCSHGLIWNPGQAPFRWLVDVAYILRRHGPTLDWSRVLEAADRMGVRLVLMHGLNYAQAELRLPVPADVLATLNRHRYGWRERYAYHCTTDPSQGGRLGRSLKVAALLARIAGQGTWHMRWRRVSLALCARWGARSLREALWLVTRKLITGDRDNWLNRKQSRPPL
jgi:hypothetical protein